MSKCGDYEKSDHSLELPQQAFRVAFAMHVVITYGDGPPKVKFLIGDMW